jgi:hypothetical protein
MRWRGENRVPGGGDAGAVGEDRAMQNEALERAKARLRGWDVGLGWASLAFLSRERSAGGCFLETTIERTRPY